MSILTDEVRCVENTSIFVTLNMAGTNQLTVFKNNVETPTENLLVIPVPHPSSIKIIDIKNYKNIFNDCENCFENMNDERQIVPTNYSPIVKIGSYTLSVVPSFDELKRTYYKYNIPVKFMKEFEGKYDKTFGYILCKIKKGNYTYHPIAYMHQALEKGKIFLPTYHHQKLNKSEHTPKIFDKLADWDHIIYGAMTDIDTTENDKYRFVTPEPIRWNYFPEEFHWASRAYLRRFTKRDLDTYTDIIARDIRFFPV
jgi:hypothetical protein